MAHECGTRTAEYQTCLYQQIILTVIIDYDSATCHVGHYAGSVIRRVDAFQRSLSVFLSQQIRHGISGMADRPRRAPTLQWEVRPLDCLFSLIVLAFPAATRSQSGKQERTPLTEAECGSKALEHVQILRSGGFVPATHVKAGAILQFARMQCLRCIFRLPDCSIKVRPELDSRLSSARLFLDPLGRASLKIYVCMPNR